MLVCLLPLSVSGLGANVSLFTDPKCLRSAGSPAILPMPFFPSCHDMKTSPSSSIIFDCFRVSKAKYTNFTFLLWENVIDCSGKINTGIQSMDITNQCAATTIIYQGQAARAWAMISCDCDYQEDLTVKITHTVEQQIQQAYTTITKQSHTHKRSRRVTKSTE